MSPTGNDPQTGMNMERRSLVTLFFCAMTGLPSVADADLSRMRRIGILQAFTENDPEARRRISAFFQSLQKLGWIEGPTFRIEIRWTGSDNERIRAYVAEIIGKKPDVIFANSNLIVPLLYRETSTIPIVFTNVADPVGNGLIASLAHPGRNLTGLSTNEFPLCGKWVEFLKEIAPRVQHIVVLRNPEQSPRAWPEIDATATSMGLDLADADVRDPAGIERGISAFAQKHDTALIVLPSPPANANRTLIISLAAMYGLPAIYPYRYFVTDGGLMSYGTDPVNEYSRAASYVDRILRGAEPAELPVEAPTKLELVVNLKTAKSLALTIPQLILASATEVIE